MNQYNRPKAEKKKEKPQVILDARAGTIQVGNTKISTSGDSVETQNRIYALEKKVERLSIKLLNQDAIIRKLTAEVNKLITRRSR